MNDIDKIKLDVINNKLEYDELLELYIKYLIVRQSIMNKILVIEKIINIM